MMIDPVTASSLGIKATSADSPLLTSKAASATAPVQGTGSFSEVLASFGENTIANLDKAESVSMSALRGDAGPREVAEAVMSAERSLQIGIAVRDKIVTAYLEISRMAI